MEVSTLELRPLKGENGGPTTDDRSGSPYPTIPTPLPPYSDTDHHDYVTSECNGFSNNGNVIDIDRHCERDTMDEALQETNEITAPALSAFYAKVMIFVASILVFLEVIPGPVPLLFFQGYVFTYLLSGSVAIFIISCIVILKRICPRIVYVEYNTNHKKTPFGQNLVYSNSIYMRIALAVFGLVTLISYVLEMAALFRTPSKCTGILHLTEVVLHRVFSFLQVPFILISAMEIIHTSGFLQYAALMHLLATNLSVCMQIFIWESAKAWLDASHVRHNSSTVWPPKDFGVTYHSIESDAKSSDVSKHHPTHAVYYTTNCYWRGPEEVENTEDLISLHLCLRNSTVGGVWEQTVPYLYAFKIQYSLIAAVMIYCMWSNLQTSHKKNREMTKVSIKGETSHKMNSSSSTKGLFYGSSVIVISIILLIVFFVHTEDKTFDKIFLITGFHIALFLVTIGAAILGIVQIKKLKSQIKHQYYMMDVLHEIEKSAVYCLGICNMVAGGISFSKTQHVVLFVDGILTMVQAFLQSLFIHQVSKKKLDPLNMDEEPGRHIVIFLILSNLGLWLFESFTTQNLESTLFQRQLFGDIPWSLILRLIMPLAIFYRFHSAVLLSEAWQKLYKIKPN